MRKTLAFILFLIPAFCFSQYKYTALYNPSWKYAIADSTQVKKVEEKKKKHLKFLFSIDSRNSEMSGQWVKMFGYKIGMEIRERYRFGFGAYGLQEQLTLEPVTTKSGKTVTPTLTKFDYSTLFTEYLFHHDFRWTGGVMMSYGNGKADIHISGENTQLDSVIHIGRIPIFALDFNGYYHVTPWLAPGLGFGYRWVRGSDERLKNSFEAPFYVIKVKFMLGRLFKTIFKNELIKVEKAEYKVEKARKKAKRNGEDSKIEQNDEGASEG